MKTLNIPTSKSITNRALIINALSGNKCTLMNISTSRDSQIMQELLASNEKELNVQDAGTVMRFLTAYYAITNQKVTLKGTERMHQRPIKILVQALRSIGTKIDYLGKEGYPPIYIKGFTSLNACLEMAIDSTVSSQYISALLMISPLLRNGIWLKLNEKVASKPYIQMTLDLMAHFGVTSEWKNGKIMIPAQTYTPNTLVIEPDWSSASYWYSYISISQNEQVFLKGYKEKSLQGDSIVAKIYEQLGVTTKFTSEGIVLSKNSFIAKKLEIDFSNYPDLAQTVLVTCAFHKINLKLTGLESLKIKETDRIAAMQHELKKINVELTEVNYGEFELKTESLSIPEILFIKTYNDHRMAMAFAPLSQWTNIEYDEKEVVAKSYPSFWKDLELFTTH